MEKSSTGVVAFGRSDVHGEKVRPETAGYFRRSEFVDTQHPPEGH